MGRISDWLVGSGPPPPPHRSRVRSGMTASAKAVDLTAAEVKVRGHERWQADAWRMLDLSGELKYATNFMGNAAARVRFFPAVIPEPDQDPVPVLDHVAPTEEGDDTPKPVISTAVAQAAVDAWERMVTVEGDKVEIQRSLAQKLFVAGEGYIIGRASVDPEVWDVLSVDEIVKDDRGLAVIDRPTSGAARTVSTSDPTDLAFKITENDYLFRVWRRHPQYRGMADSNVRAVLEDLEELVTIARTIRNAARLRLNAGILTIPDELSFSHFQPPQEVVFGETDPPVIVIGDDAGEQPDDEDQLDRQLVEQLMDPTVNPDSPAGVVPLLLRGPGEYLKNDMLRHFTITVDVPDKLLARAEFLLKRVATGLDVPPEILTGIADINHWGAWQVERSTYDAHVEPMILLMASQFASGFLRPALLAAGFSREEVARVVVGTDPSDLVARPNRGEDAKAAHEMLIISNRTAREALDFSEGDAPDSEELAERYALKRGIGGQDLTALIMRLVELLPADALLPSEREAEQRIAEGRGEEPPEPEPPAEGPPPDDEPPDEDEATVASTDPGATSAVEVLRQMSHLTAAADPGMALVAIDRDLRQRLQVAADAALSRALERAGARVRGKTKEHSAEQAAIRGVSATDVPAHLGRSIVAALGLEDDDLLAGEFEALGPKWDRWVERAQASAVGIAGALVTLTDSEREELAARQAEDRDAGWLVLLAALLALGRARLFDPSPTAPPEGEWDDTLAVQPGVLREALATAGGSGRVPLTPGPPGQVATGDRLLAIMADHGAVTEGWRWVHGDPARPFPPHAALDGKVVTNWDEPDDDRRSDEAWVPFGMYEPGDHAGCTCHVAPVFTPAQREAAA